MRCAWLGRVATSLIAVVGALRHLLWACALFVQSVSAPAQQATRLAPDRQGFLFEVTAHASAVTPATTALAAPGTSPEAKPVARLILFGTIHLDRRGALALNATSARELGHAQRLALEADPSDSTTVVRLVRKYGYYAAGDGLSKHLPSDDLALARRLASDYGLDAEQIESFKPWFLANYLVTAALIREGFDPQGGSESTLLKFAAARAIPVVEIEGLDRQFGIFDHEPESLQREQLVQSREEIVSGRLLSETTTLLRAWHEADDSAMTSMLDQMKAAETPYAHFTLVELILERDRSMADRAEDYLREGGVTFFAVGSLHLFGDAGLIEELRRRGYRVRDLQAPASVGDTL